MLSSYVVVPVAAIVGAVGGKFLGQSVPISDQTAITLGMVGTAVGLAFGVGAILTGIRRDIKEIKSKISDLPCVRHHRASVCEKDED